MMVCSWYIGLLPCDSSCNDCTFTMHKVILNSLKIVLLSICDLYQSQNSELYDVHIHAMPCCYPRTCQPLGHELIGPTKYDYCCNSHDYCTSSGNMDCIFVLMVYVLYYHRTSTAVESSLFALRRGHAARECVVGLAQ